MFACQECGRKFKTAKAAERASNQGCPKCGGVDIDLDSNPPQPKLTEIQRVRYLLGMPFPEER